MRIGIDLGGTKIEGIALDDHGHEHFRERVPTPRNDYEATLAAISGLVRDIEQHTDQQGTVGMGIPGAISPHTGLVKNANSTWLIGKPLKQDLEERLQREVRISNDANCFVVSEATDGAARDGANAIGGEWGHNPLPWPMADELPGPTCYCGQQGCIETFLSGPGFSRDFQHQGGPAISAPEIVELARTGDPLALSCLARYEQRMARALASVINIIDPEIIVLGGGMSNIPQLYENIPKLWGQYVFSDYVATRLVAPMYGDSSGVRGAAWLWPID